MSNNKALENFDSLALEELRLGLKAYMEALDLYIQAESRADKAIEEVKKSRIPAAEAIANLARIYHRQGNIDEAIGQIKFATRLTPDNEEYTKICVAWEKEKNNSCLN